ncbi:MAG: WGR domain-containing protein, partial [Myxococcales bacterium]|nr:WGR domain-containing protein [Myxococcales bacterium]
MRRFELVDAKSNKFWEIELEGSSFTVRYGKIGTSGQTQTKSFGDAGAAKTEHDKLVQQKTKKGYVE